MMWKSLLVGALILALEPLAVGTWSRIALIATLVVTSCMVRMASEFEKQVESDHYGR